MSDDTTKRGSPDTKHINVNQAHELAYWIKALDVTEAELRMAVKRVGNSPDAVREHLDKQRKAAMKRDPSPMR